jgi:hypothetical protein
MSIIQSPFSIQLITSSFSSILIILHRFLTWIALRDVDLHFSLMLVRKDAPVEEKTKRAT